MFVPMKEAARISDKDRDRYAQIPAPVLIAIAKAINAGVSTVRAVLNQTNAVGAGHSKGRQAVEYAEKYLRGTWRPKV